MSAVRMNAVNLRGSGPVPMTSAHGFGCDRHLGPQDSPARAQELADNRAGLASVAAIKACMARSEPQQAR